MQTAIMKEKKEEKSCTTHSKAGNASQPWLLQGDFLASLFKQKSSTMWSRDLKWQLDWQRKMFGGVAHAHQTNSILNWIVFTSFKIQTEACRRLQRILVMQSLKWAFLPRLALQGFWRGRDGSNNITHITWTHSGRLSTNRLILSCWNNEVPSTKPGVMQSQCKKAKQALDKTVPRENKMA